MVRRAYKYFLTCSNLATRKTIRTHTSRHAYLYATATRALGDSGKAEQSKLATRYQSAISAAWPAGIVRGSHRTQ